MSGEPQTHKSVCVCVCVCVCVFLTAHTAGVTVIVVGVAHRPKRRRCAFALWGRTTVIEKQSHQCSRPLSHKHTFSLFFPKKKHKHTFSLKKVKSIYTFWVLYL